MLLLKCLGEILPSLGSNAMPAVATGYYTLVDQALDIARGRQPGQGKESHDGY